MSRQYLFHRQHSAALAGSGNRGTQHALSRQDYNTEIRATRTVNAAYK